jgi:hypothetical protein
MEPVFFTHQTLCFEQLLACLSNFHTSSFLAKKNLPLSCICIMKLFNIFPLIAFFASAAKL